MITSLVRLSHFVSHSLIGAALALALVPAMAQQTRQGECPDWEDLVALTLDGFPGFDGRVIFTGSLENPWTIYELAKPVSNFEACRLLVPNSPRTGDPSLSCDLVKSAGIDPVVGTQTAEMIQMWTRIGGSIARDNAGRCLGVVPSGPKATKTKEGREDSKWQLLVARPDLSSSAEAAIVLTVDQAPAGAEMNQTQGQPKITMRALRITKPGLEESISKRPPNRVAIADFQQFVGLRVGAKAENVMRQFGKPTKTRHNEDKTTIYNDYANRIAHGVRLEGGLSVGVDAATGEVKWLTLNHADVLFWLRRRGIGDQKMNLLGMHRDEVVALLGQPDRVSSNSYRWKTKVGEKTVLVTFRCYDHDQGKCSELEVGWL